MTTKTDALSNSPGAPPRRSLFGVISDHPILFGLAVAVGAALLAGALFLIGGFSGSEEATIRVRNGSLEFIILDSDQQWTQAGSSGNYRNRDAEKQSDKYEVTVVPAGAHTCNLYSRIGTDIEFTYSDEKKIRVQSQNKNTWVKPEGVSVTWNSATPQTLTYTPTGYLSRITVDNQLLCTFTNPAQLSSVLIMDVP